MANIINKKNSSKVMISVGILFLLIGVFIVLKVVATSSIKVDWSYKSGDDYIVCQIVDEECGISKITNYDGDDGRYIGNFDVGQKEPFTIKYLLGDNETGFRIWNTKDEFKDVCLADVNLNVSAAYTNAGGNILAIAANVEKGKIDKIKYGSVQKTYNTNCVYESLELDEGGKTEAIITTSDNVDIKVNLDRDTDLPEDVHIYKNNRDEIALTARSKSGIWKITELDGKEIIRVDKFEKCGTYLFKSTGSQVIVKSAVGNEKKVDIPSDVVKDEGIEVNIEYEETKFVVDASSNLGLWKITDKDNDNLIIYKYQDEPKDFSYSISRDFNLSGIKVYNMAGNYKEVEFDKKGPDVLWTYKNTDQNTIIACIEDTESGLKCVKDDFGNVKFTFNHKDSRATFEYCIENNVDKLNIYDYEDNVSVLDFSTIKFNVDSAYKNIDGNMISIVASMNNGEKIDRITYLNDELIGEVNQNKMDTIYNLEHDGTVKVKLYDKTGDFVIVLLDYEEDDVPKVNKFSKSELKRKIYLRVKDEESGIDKITYKNGIEIKKFSEYTTSIDDTYQLDSNAEEVLIWDRVGNFVQVDFTANFIDEEGPELIDAIQYASNGDDYTIAIRDSISGLYKITTLTGKVIYDFCEDGYPDYSTYNGKLSTDGNKIKIYDRLGNYTTLNVDGKGPTVMSITPRGDNPTDWRLIAIDEETGILKLTYENGRVIKDDIQRSTEQQTIDFSVDKGTRVIRVFDTQENYEEIVLDEDKPQILSLAKMFKNNMWELEAQDLGSGLKSVRTTPAGSDIATFGGNTRQKEKITLEIPETANEIYVLDQAGNISDAYQVDREKAIVVSGEVEIKPEDGEKEIHSGIEIDKNNGDETILKLYNEVSINKNNVTGKISQMPGISIPEGATVKILIGDNDVHIYGGYVGSGYRSTDANYIHYPGISVPEGATLIIEEKPGGGKGTLYVYGNGTTDYGIGDGSGAGIGGYGVVNGNSGVKIYGQSSGRIEIRSGKVVSVSNATSDAYGTGAGIGGGGACAWRGIAEAGAGNVNNIIIYDGASVEARTNGTRGVGANIGSGGKFDKRNRRGISGETSIVRESDLPKVEVSHVVKDNNTAIIEVKAQSEVGLYMVCLEDQKVVFEKFPTIEKVCSFIVDENREYTIKVIDKDDLTEVVKYKIDDIGKSTIPEQEDNKEPLNDSIVYVSESTDKGIKINRDCTIIFENENDIVINKEYRINDDGMAGIQIKDGVNVKILKKGRGNVAIYGGHKNNSISYPGIMVQEHSTLEIYGTLDSTIYAFGYGMVTDKNIMVGGTGAGIGGYGHYNQIGDAKGQDCGSVKIMSGNVEAFGGTIEVKTGTSCGTGAGIGGGGAYSVVGMANSGRVKGKIENRGGRLIALGGLSKRARGAKFGDGGSYTAEGVNIKGQEVNVECDYIEIRKDTKITGTSKKGYKITKDCKLTFENTEDIIIGSTKIGCAGISIEKGVEARISVEGSGNIAIYGGYQIKNPDYCVMYPGIEVPKGASLIIDNNTAKSLSLYAGGVDEIPVTASAIGTCGVYSTSKFVASEDVGVIVINGGCVNINTRKTENKVAAIGAGIGSGGIGSSNKDAVLKQGVLGANNYRVADIANVVINTNNTTKIGNGSMLKGEKVIAGEEKVYKVIDTLAPYVEIGRIDSGKLQYAQIKISAKDTLSGLSKVVLDDGTVYRFPRWGQEIGSLYFKRYRNGKVRAKVYDTEGNYKEVSYVVKGLDKSEINELINIDVKDKTVYKVGDSEYVNVLFKKQERDVRMYVRVNNQQERLVHRGSDEFNYSLQVLDNCSITARMEDVETLETIWEDSKIISNRVKVVTNDISDKKSTEAVVEGMIEGLYKEDYASNKIKKIGAYYSAVGENKKVLNVSQDNLENGVLIDEISMKYKLTMTRLKPDTKYKVQVYVINDLGKEIKGEEKYFVTKANGKGLTIRHYEVDSNIPTLIRQSYNKNLTTDIEVLEPIRNKYGEIIIDRVSKGNMEWVGSIAPIDSRRIWFKVDSNKDLTMEIGKESIDILKGENCFVTKDVYMQGKRYPFKMSTKGDTAGEIKVQVSWLEDGKFQEITHSQFYPKEYVKIESLVVDAKGKLVEEVDINTGKVVNKKVLSKGRVVRKLDIANEKVVLENGAILKIGKHAKVEGNIILKEEGAILPIIDNIDVINYKNSDVTLKNGTKLKLYRDVDVVGCVEDLRNNKVYDLCKYIQKVSGKRIMMSDGRKLSLENDVRIVDNNYILSLYPNTYETKEYQELMNEYATVERLVYEMSTSNIKDVSIGEARLYEVIPIKILLSCDGDDVFTMKDPVIEIDGALTNDKNGKIKSNLKLELPGDDIKTGYASWSYMNKLNGNYLREGDSSNYATIEKMRNGNFKVTLDGYSKKYGKALGYDDNNVMLNLLLQVEKSENVNAEEVINNIALYTKVKIKEITIENKQTKIDTEDSTLSIKIKK